MAHAYPHRHINSKTVEIILPRGFCVLIDAEDLEKVMAFRFWSASKSGETRYATHNGRTRVSMHRLILGVGKTDRQTVVDHINGNGLDNRKANLRIVTQSQNLRWKRKLSGASKFKGVSKGTSKARPWAARVFFEGKTRQLGSFATQEEAARCYDDWAKTTYGEFARLNFPGDFEIKKDSA